MIAYIVCEGDFEAQLLQRILPKSLLTGVQIVAAGGFSAAKSLARSLLVRRQVPMAIVVDADSVDPDLIQERLTSTENIISSVAVNTSTRVILAVPSFEMIFFQDHFLLARLLGYEPSQDMLNLAISQPRKALQQLLANSHTNPSQIINKLTDEEMATLLKAPVIQELIHFLTSVQELATVK
jgi:hypothetical protein